MAQRVVVISLVFTIFTLVKSAAILLSIIILLSPVIVRGQQYNYQQYSLKDGLAGLTVYSIAQDHDGFLWIGTETGLSRFDGKNFKNYTVSDGLPDNEIIKVFVDSKNRIWLLPFTNTVCYFEDGVLHTRDNDSLLKKLNMNSVAYSICEDKRGEVAVLTETSVFIFENQSVKEIWEVYKRDKDKAPIANVGLNQNGDFIFAIPEFKNIKSYDLCYIHDNKFFPYRHMDLDFFQPRNSIILDKNRIVCPFNNKLTIHNYQMNYVVSYAFNETLLNTSSISDTTFTINTLDTVYLCKSNTERVLASIPISSVVNCVFQDKEGNYWFGSIGNGLLKINSLNFLNLSLRNNKNHLPVYSVLKDKEFLYAGTNSGLLWRKNFFSGKIEKIEILPFSSEKNISSLFKDDNGLLLGTGDGVWSFTKTLKNIGGSNSNVKTVSKFHDTILAATHNNIYLFSGVLYNKIDTIIVNRTTCAKKLNNLIYAGTPQGLYTIKGKTISYLGDIDPLLKSRISNLQQAPDGNIWLATYGRGLIALNKNNEVISVLTEKDGLSSNMCRCIEINNNALWVGTDKGINRIDLSKPSDIRTFSSKDGLDCDIINCLFVDADTVYAGTPYGVTSFSVNDIESNSFCGIKINSFVSEKTSFVNPAERIVLPAGDNSFTIDYSGISMKSNGDITFYYRMSGQQDNWQTTKENILQYASLNPGSYRFEIYAVNAFGKKSKVVVLPLTIEKMFYQQTWFIFLCSFLVAGLCAWAVNMYIKRIQKKNDDRTAILQKINELEQRALKSQMNPHFVFNCLNSIQQFIFEKDPKESNKFITDFASIIRQTMDLSDKKFISIGEEKKYLTTYLNIEKVRFQNKFSYQIEVEKNISTDENIIPPLLLQPFLENSIRHGMRNLSGRAGELKVSFTKENNYLVCTIDDNGIGREAASKLKDSFSAEYQSKGLSLVTQRIETLNRDLMAKVKLEIIDKIDSHHASGTRVILKLPFEITTHFG